MPSQAIIFGIPSATLSARAVELQETLLSFMREHVLPAEADYAHYRESVAPDNHTVPPVVEELKALARTRGLWNLFLPSESGLSQLEYAPLAELTGWSQDLAPEALNCQAPDTGNMELLHLFGTPEHKRTWLGPLLDGRIRSAFAMTEPDVASSDARNISTMISRHGDDFMVSGRKWWASGASDPRCKVFIVMGRNDDAMERSGEHTMLVVPADTPGIRVLRSTTVFGRQDQQGHSEVVFDEVRVPMSAVLGEIGGGFVAAQARLGPGRIHHCMRALGAAERAMAMMVERAKSRSVFGATLVEHGMVQRQIAESRIAIEQARALCHRAAWAIDTSGNAAARDIVSMAKVAVPHAVLLTIDNAIQIHGGAGVSDDTPLAAMYGWHRAMRIFDGPDEVHLRSIARAELRRDPILDLPSGL